MPQVCSEKLSPKRKQWLQEQMENLEVVPRKNHLSQNEYWAVHDWLRRNFKKPKHCFLCLKIKPLDWACIKKYEKNIDNFKALCRKCHMVLDSPLRRDKHWDWKPDHLCRNRLCVNPQHIRIVKRENFRGISPSVIHAKKTHCPRGHELSGNNLVKYKLKIGQRNCRTCLNMWQRVYYQRDRKKNG